MSSRVLKKLHGGEPEFVVEVSDGESANVTATQSGTKKKQLNVNRYDLLLPQSLSESEVKEDDNETEALSAAEQAAKKKKKKRKKKGGGKHTSTRRSSEDNADVSDLSVSRSTFSVATGSRKVDVERGVPEDGDLPSISPKLQAVTMAKIKAILNVHHKNLNPIYEMKRMFGSKVVQQEKVLFLFKNKRRNTRGAQRPLKSTWLVTAKDVWPPVGKTGISMNLVPSQQPPTSHQEVIHFAFEHNPSYRELQEKFLVAIESNDTNNIVTIVNEQPYHIDSLIQLSELCKMTEDMSTAAQLIEHAIFALESSFHPMFSLTGGNCRLDYRRQENRALFVTLFKHAQYLESRACPRTALEIAKLILTFDPLNDPLAMILTIDYYAIRAKQYDWLLELYRVWEQSHNLSQLPNMAYSHALALFYREQQADEDVHIGSDQALQYALMMFPGVLMPLLQEMSVQIDSRVKSHSFFTQTAQKTQTVALQQLTSLYVCRSHQVWRDADLLPWLEANVNAVLDAVDRKQEIINEFAVKRTQRYKTPPLEILRHIVLSDFREKVPLMPFIAKESEPIVMYDPLPPPDSINIYARPKNNAFRTAGAASPFNAANNNQNASSISMFFQSLLPSFNAPPQPQQQQQQQQQAGDEDHVNHEEGAVAAAVENVVVQSDLRSGLDSMNEFLRYFLSNTRTPEQRPHDADVDESDESTEGDEEDDANTT